MFIPMVFPIFQAILSSPSLFFLFKRLNPRLFSSLKQKKTKFGMLNQTSASNHRVSPNVDGKQAKPQRTDQIPITYTKRYNSVETPRTKTQKLAVV